MKFSHFHINVIHVKLKEMQALHFDFFIKTRFFVF